MEELHNAEFPLKDLQWIVTALGMVARDARMNGENAASLEIVRDRASINLEMAKTKEYGTGDVQVDGGSTDA